MIYRGQMLIISSPGDWVPREFFIQVLSNVFSLNSNSPDFDFIIFIDFISLPFSSERETGACITLLNGFKSISTSTNSSIDLFRNSALSPPELSSRT